MAKAKSSGSKNSVYRITELVGTSENSWEEAAANAVKTAASTLREIRIAEISRFDVVVDNKGRVSAYRVRLNLSFKYEK